MAVCECLFLEIIYWVNLSEITHLKVFTIKYIKVNMPFHTNIFYIVIETIVCQHAYTEEYEQQRGKGSFPAMITPGYQMAKKAHDMASDVSFDNFLYL